MGFLMPWRNRYITTRRHADGIALYLLTLTLGLCFLLNAFGAVTVDAALNHWWQVVWEWLLSIGGAMGITAVAWPQRHLAFALGMEQAGAFASFCGMSVYTLAVIDIGGWSSPGWVLLGLIALGHAGRAWQVWRDLQTLDDLALQVQKENL